MSQCWWRVTVIADLQTLQAKVAEQAAEIATLEAELAETNKGVLALYSELDQNAVQLREAADLKSRFLSYMSHEFRTPLASVTGITNLLMLGMDGTLTTEQQHQIKLIQDSIRELSDMVDDLLDLAKVEAGRISISPEWFAMVDLFSALRGMFRPIVNNNVVSLIFEEPEGVTTLYTDDKKLSQILRNFISNALKFTPRGEIRVTARAMPDDMIEFAISDTGIGIEPEYLSTLFSDFVQIDSRVQKRLRGTGLGLSLSKKFAELLGGRVAVQSKPGKGSRFSVSIPARYRGQD
ncbi:MAG TPA: ATP-binding protein [Steroidobacteraceae bacterium]|nr:ATP-binding protein [Steroidobacteraceae bacterium]